MNEALVCEQILSDDADDTLDADGYRDIEPTMRILLAEDDDEIRALLAQILRRDGHWVVEARDGAELLEALASTLIERPAAPRSACGFDLVICNQELPGMPGLTVLAGLRARHCDGAFVLIARDPAVQMRARRLGGIILDHPFSAGAIRGAVACSVDQLPAELPANDWR